MEEFLNSIIQKKMPCYFISPHLDDAMLSAGGLITHLGTKTKVTVVSIFTEGSEKPYTRAAKGFLRYCGYTDAKGLFAERRAEDARACQKAHAEFIHLNFLDGSFRERTKPNRVFQCLGKHIPELNHLYPLGFKIINLAKDDLFLFEAVKEKLLQIVAKEKEYIVFCPLGSVKHMDHTLTRDICGSTFKNLIFWSDYPYSLRSHETKKLLEKLQVQEFVWDKNLEQKKELIKFYKTQLPSLPKDVLDVKEEKYYYK